MSEPNQPDVLQEISDDWKNRDKSPEGDEGDPNTKGEEPEPAPVPKPAPATRRPATKAAAKEG